MTNQSFLIIWWKYHVNNNNKCICVNSGFLFFHHLPPHPLPPLDYDRLWIFSIPSHHHTITHITICRYHNCICQEPGGWFTGKPSWLSLWVLITYQSYSVSLYFYVFDIKYNKCFNAWEIKISSKILKGN